ncbi:MAG: DNA polymerase III subunit delta [Bacteroidota bacterium]
MAAKPGPSYDDLATAFRHGNFQPLYFFYGEEGFLIDELQTLLVEHALQPHERDFNLDLVYGAESDVQRALALCASFPVMAQRRVVVVRDFEKLQGNRAFQHYAAQPNPSAVVLLACRSKPNLSAHPYRALKQHAVAAEFKPLYDRQMPGWIGQRLRQRGLQAASGVPQMIAEAVGTDLRTAAQEVEKLAVYLGDRKRVTPDDVVAAGGHTREFNIFELQKAIGQGDAVRAQTIADQMLRQAANRRGEALMIVAMLTRYVGLLAKAADGQAKRLSDRDLARHIGVSPYFVKEYTFALRTLGLAAIPRTFEALLAADYELKGGSTRDERLVVLLLLRRILSSPAPTRRAA